MHTTHSIFHFPLRKHIQHIVSCCIRYSCWGFGITLLVLMLLQITIRSATTMSAPWTDELIKLSFTWYCMLSAVIAFWDNSHITIDYFVNRLPKRYGALAVTAANLITFGLACMLIPYTLELVQTAIPQTTISLRISMAWFYAAFPFSFFFIALDRTEATFNAAFKGAQT